MISPVTHGTIYTAYSLKTIDRLYVNIINDLYKWRNKSWDADLFKITKRWFDHQTSSVEHDLKLICYSWHEAIEAIVGETRPKRQAAVLLGTAGLLSGIFSFGMNVLSRKELDHLYEETKRLDENQHRLLHKIQLNEKAYEEILEKSLRKLADGMVKERARELFAQLKHKLKDTKDKAVVGFYQALRGNLDPHLVSPTELKRGLEGLEDRASKMGLKIAPVENMQEILFSLPISVLMKGDELHMWISVPLVSIDSPIFDIYRVEHEPIPRKGLLFGLRSQKPYLAVDARRELHLDFNEADLNACIHHRNYYLCDWTAFTTKTNSCSIALFRGKKNCALKLCARTRAVVPAFVTCILTYAPERLVEVTTNVPTYGQIRRYEESHSPHRLSTESGRSGSLCAPPHCSGGNCE